MLTVIAVRRWVVGHGFCLALYKGARSVECRYALGKVISIAINKGIQKGLEAEVVHGNAGRSLTQIEAYDPEVEGKYVAADDQGNTDATPEFSWFQPSLDQVVVPIYTESGSVDREMLLSDAIPAIHLSVKRRELCPPSSSALGGSFLASARFHILSSSLGVQISGLLHWSWSGDGGSNQPLPLFQKKVRTMICFDTSVLDKYW
ncbi:hypothetical protein Tco_0517958, partial [Tanacetum coccineum]